MKNDNHKQNDSYQILMILFISIMDKRGRLMIIVLQEEQV